ncbi:MAG: DNRLRE domain-containing protein [Thermoplasmata archaeon]|nr:MAG: DNRLRE domain-containing protein [Thermoplasmata archaeon]
MNQKNCTKLGCTSNYSSKIFIFSSVIFLLLVNCFTQTYSAISEPIVSDNPDGSFTADWPLVNSSEYNLFNLSMNNGEVNLTLNSFWCNQSTQSEFATGNMSKINNTDPLGTLELNTSTFGSGKNLIENGKFDTSENWSFNSSQNITSEWSSDGKYGRLSHYSASNPIFRGEQIVSEATGSGDPVPGSMSVVETLQYADDVNYYEMDIDKNLTITRFNISARSGIISEVWLWGCHRVDIGNNYIGTESLRYKNNTSVFLPSSIIPHKSNTTWTKQSHNITDAFYPWTWDNVTNLEVYFLNDDENPKDSVFWDRIWLEVTIERFDQTAYINQTFEVLNNTGFIDTLYEDFSKNEENRNVNFTLEPDSVTLDYSGTLSSGQATLYANVTGGGASYIGIDAWTDLNFGGAPKLIVGSSSFTFRSLIRFDTNLIPSDSIITDAILQLWVEGLSNNIQINVYRLVQDWDEGSDNGTEKPAKDGVTWEKADAQPDTPWGQFGGNRDPLVYCSTTVTTLDNWHYFDLTSLVQEWVNGNGNYGLLLKQANEGLDNMVEFTSDDSLSSDHRPQLIVNWEQPNYHTYGNFTSQVLDAEETVKDWGLLNWNSYTPPGTRISVETRTSMDNISWSDWYDNSSTPGYQISSPEGRYIQYRAHLITPDSTTSPVLYDVLIIFSSTPLKFEWKVDRSLNVTDAEMSIAINDTIVWSKPARSESTWTSDFQDISEHILSKGLYKISLRLRLIIETEYEVNCTVGYDNVTIGGSENENIGEYISIGFDARSKAIWREIKWNMSLEPDTNIIIQTRTSDINNSWPQWSSACSNPFGSPIESGDNQYFQYRAILLSTNSSNTPNLFDANILYSKYCSNGTLEMKSDFTTENLTSWGVFNAEAIYVQYIAFLYSIDSGTNWDPVPSGWNMDPVEISSGTIRFKAEFLPPDTSITPTLLGFSLRYLTNNIPELQGGNLINETGAFGGGWFNFSVQYLDRDDDYPTPIKLTVFGQGNYNLSMDELDPFDFNMTDGKWYFCNISLPKGSYQYLFIAYDGKTWASTSPVGITVYNNHPELKYGIVSPPTGKGKDSFNFTVAYYDYDNDAPQTMNLTLVSSPPINYIMKEIDGTDTVYSDGKDYYYELTLNKSIYTYFFYANDGEVRNNSTSSILYVGNNPPGLSSSPVLPSSGNITTTFNFTVTYRDIDEDWPGMVLLNLSNASNSTSYIMWEVDEDDLNCLDGKDYYYPRTGLTKGTYTYYFAANDTGGDWTESKETYVLEVDNSEPLIQTGDITNADEDSLYSVQYNSSDVDSDDCIWLLSTNASWLSLDPDTGDLTGTPDNGDVGRFWVNVSVRDNDGGMNWTYFILTVTNSPPQIVTTSPPEIAYENQQYSYDFYGYDEAEGNAFWSLDTNASWLNINSANGILSGTPGSADVGSFWVNVTLNDGNGEYDFLNFVIIIADVSNPIAEAGSDDSVFEDEPHSFDGSGSFDNSGQITNYTWYFGDGTISYDVNPIHTYTNQGVYFVVLVVKDAAGNEGYDTIKITVTNAAPVAVAGLDKNSNEGEPVNFDASDSYDTQSDNSTLIYLWDFDDDGQFNDGVGQVSSFAWYDEGIYTVSLKVVDDNGDFSVDTLNVTVSNLPPMIELGGPYSGIEGSIIFFFADAQDEGDDVLWFRWDWDNDGINDTGWETTPYADHIWNQFGTHTLGIEVWDGDDGYADDTATVEVLRAKHPPIISGVGGRYVHFDYPYLLNLAPYVTDPDTPKDELIITTSDSTHIKVNGLILTLNYPESMIWQTRIVIITVSDGQNTDNDTLTVSITANYPPEISSEIPDIIFDEGETLEDEIDLDNYFNDKDNDTLSYHFIGNVHIRAEINSTTNFVTFSAGPNWYGVENLTVRAYDPNGAFIEQVFKVTVNAVNFPPTIKGIQDVYVRLNSPWELFVLNPVYVWDDDSILDLILSTDSSYVTLSTTKEGVLEFHYIDPSITTDVIQISVSDGEYTASTDVTVHISLLNWPPYIKDFSYPSDVRFDEDTVLSDHMNLNHYFADNTTDQLTFMQIVSGDDIFVTINDQGLVSFSAKENWFGVTTVTFRAQDGTGAWVSFTINATVNSVNDAPEIAQKITYLRVKEDETWIVDLDDYFDDVEDKNNLTFSCNKPAIIIDPLTHEAKWKRNGESSLEGVVFTASDGEASISMEKVDLKVVETFNWLWMVMAALFGAFGVLVYRELKYRYKIEEVFIVNNAGIILTHLSRGESKLAVDVELVGAMLTAVQQFVKDSFLDGKQDSELIEDKKRSLEKLEFGGFHLILEPGDCTLMCVVISGYVNNRLRKRMRAVLDEFEEKYTDDLKEWDGNVDTFAEAKYIIAKLFKKSGDDEELKSALDVLREVTAEGYETGFEEMPIYELTESSDSGYTNEEIYSSEEPPPPPRD